MLTYIILGFLSFRTFAALETEASIRFYTESLTDSRVGSSNAQTHIYTCKLAQDLGYWGQLSLC